MLTSVGVAPALGHVRMGRGGEQCQHRRDEREAGAGGELGSGGGLRA